MNISDVNNIGDLIIFLSQFNPNLDITVYNVESGMDDPLQHIEIESDRIVIYS